MSARVTSVFEEVKRLFSKKVDDLDNRPPALIALSIQVLQGLYIRVAPLTRLSKACAPFVYPPFE